MSKELKETIIKSNIVDQYVKDKTRYAMVVNKVRSVPSIKDGLKTIHRRIIYAAYKDRRCISRSTKIKSAELVGTVMGNYHPHGDSSTYSAIKPLTNWFEVNMPLFNGEGNWGTFQGDSEAAMRYTETYLSSFTMDCIVKDLNDAPSIVDWDLNYTQSRSEPKFLPVAVPLLLINGAFGIGYGLHCSIPMHNINEVLDATIHLIKHPNAKITLIPDQCMECDILDTDFDKICDTGSGIFKVRGRISTGNVTIKGSEYPMLTITSVPDSVKLDSVVASIIKLIDSNVLPQVQDVQDESYLDKKTNRDVMKYNIILKRGSDPNYVRDMIYKKTEMEKTFTVSFEVLDELESIKPSYTEYLRYFIEFRKNTKHRYYSAVYRKADTALHEKEAFIKVLESGEVDNIINMIKSLSSTDDKVVVEYLINKLKITDLQASYIINANLKKLSKGYLNKYKEEAKNLMMIRANAAKAITDVSIIENEIVNELQHFKKVYGKPRNSKLIDSSKINDIPEGEFNIIITSDTIKKVNSAQGIGKMKGLTPRFIKTLSNTDNLFLFDRNGKVFKIPVHKIPVSDVVSNGIDIRILIKNISEVVAITGEEELNASLSRKVKPTLLVLSENGFIKRVDIEDIINAPLNGFTYASVDDDDAIKIISIYYSGDICVFANNKAIRFDKSETPIYKRNAKGVKTIASSKIKKVDGIGILNPKCDCILVFTNNGYVNKILPSSLPKTSRNKSGQSIIKLTKGDKIKWIMPANNSNELKVTDIYNDETTLVVKDIKNGSSISTGVKVFNKNVTLYTVSIVK